MLKEAGGRGVGWGDNRGRRDLLHLEFRAFSSPTRWKREEIIKKWGKCRGRWAAGGRLHAACVPNDWFHHQSPPERLLMKQLSHICLLPDTVCFYYFFFVPNSVFSKCGESTQTRWWQPPKTFLRNSPRFSISSGTKCSVWFPTQPPLCYRPCAADASLFMRRWCESMSGNEEKSQPVTQGSNSKAIQLQLTWILRVHFKKDLTVFIPHWWSRIKYGALIL